MTDPELRKRIQRYFFAQDRFLLDRDHSSYWLDEMKNNRKLIEQHFEHEQEEEANLLQLKLFK